MPTGQRIEAVLTRVRLVDRNIDHVAAPPGPDRARPERGLNARRQARLGRTDDVEGEKLRTAELLGPRGAALKHALTFDRLVAGAKMRNRAALHALVRRLGA